MLYLMEENVALRSILFFILVQFGFMTIGLGSARSEETSASFRPLEEYNFSTYRDNRDRTGVRTDGVVVVHKGKIVYEKYARGYGRNSRHWTWSISKSVLSMLVGIAARDGSIKPSDSVCNWIEAGNRPDVPCSVTVLDLLEWSSGLDWNESYEGASDISASSVAQMLYGDGRRDMGLFVLKHPSYAPPGARFRYSSGDTNALSRVMRSATKSWSSDWPWKKLFNKIGLDGVVFERDASGTFVGSSAFYGTARELVAIGQLMMKRGEWNGEQVLPRDWIDFLLTPGRAAARDPGQVDDRVYPGRSWWLNRALDGRGRGLSSAPEDTFMALGHWGQSIVVVPSEELIIVRLADDRDHSFDLDRHVRLALEAIGAPIKSESGDPFRSQTGVAPGYSAGMFKIGAGYTAQLVCSCVFVMKRDEDFCRELARVSPDIGHFGVDYVRRRVYGQAIFRGTWSYERVPRLGCEIQ